MLHGIKFKVSNEVGSNFTWVSAKNYEVESVTIWFNDGLYCIDEWHEYKTKAKAIAQAKQMIENSVGELKYFNK